MQKNIKVIKKINYYLDNDQEREYIINKGFNVFKKKYNARTFWASIMKEINCEL